jgi:hypothetical protein
VEASGKRRNFCGFHKSWCIPAGSLYYLTLKQKRR